VAATFLHWRWLGSWAFDEEMARASGIPTALLRYALIILIAATVIVAARLVGVLLVAALLVLPGAVGTLIAIRLWRVYALSIGTALGSGLIGMAASNAADVPPGPAIVLVAFSFFLMSFIWRRRSDRQLAPGGMTFDSGSPH
jgi:ABC-type Mn2+/Zn2+ transport system permease subunit